MNIRDVVSTALSVAVALGFGLALAEQPVVDSTSCAERVYDRLFFGLGTSTGIVSDEDWSRFLSEVMTPRFADGLTVVEAYGQWRGAGDRKVTVERARVVEIAHEDSPEIDRAIGEVVAIYKRRHQQRSVMRTRGRLDVCL